MLSPIESRLMASDPQASKWRIMLDNLNTHQSEALVRWVAHLEGIPEETDSASKAKVAFCTHWRVERPFCMTARTRSSSTTPAIHASWMNQVEIWLSILVRKLLKRGNFLSVDDLRDQMLAFIAYYNRTMAKPIKWTYTGLS
jgi:hypothetical protein